MKRRIFGFVLGAAMGVGTAYLTRRFLNSQKAQALLPVPASEKPAPVDPKSSSEETATEKGTRQSVRYTVRRTGPRPQSSADGSESEVTGGVKINRATEPPAATETDAAATSPRSETFEAIEVPDVKVEPAHTEVAEASEVEKDVSKEEVQAKAQAAGTEAEDEDSETDETDATPAEADFTPISGIGEVFNRRLHDSGINTFEAFAALSAEEIAEKTGIPQDRIERDKWLEQVKALIEPKKPRKPKKAASSKATSPNESN